MGRKLFTILFLGISILCVGNTSHAEFFENTLDGLRLDSEYTDGVLGIGVWISKEPYTGVDADVFPVPMADIEYKGFYLDGAYFGYHFYKNEDMGLKLSLTGLARIFTGYEASDSTILSGMSDRNGTLESGLRLSWENEYFTADVSGVTDILEAHEGQEVRATISRSFLEGAVTPRVGVRWQSEAFIDYYYGVRPSEVTATRANYEPEGTTNFIGGVTIAVPLGERWALAFDFEYESYGSEIEDSPITDEGGDITYVAGAVYRF